MLPKNDINRSFQEKQQFVLIGMHFPLVTFARRGDGQEADMPTVEFHRQHLNSRRCPRD